MYSPSYEPRDWQTPEGCYSQDGRIYWPDRYDEIFRRGLYELFLANEHCDFTLVTSTSTTKAHKIVLAANSDYFKTMFRQDCSETRSNGVDFDKFEAGDNSFITSTGLSAILEYAYTGGSFPVTEDSVIYSDIFETARYLLMTCVEEFFSHKIESIPENQNNLALLFVQDLETCRDGYGKKVRHNLYELFLAEELCDVTLVTSTSEIKAHKIVLAANSKYFKSMFRNTSLDVVPFVDNPAITSTGLSAILEYAYRGSFSVTDDSVCDILEAARYFLLPHVQEACGRKIESIDVNQNNFAWLFEAARKFNLPVVKRRVNRFLHIDVDRNNFAWLLEAARNFDLPTVQRRVDRFVRSINVTMDNYVNIFEVAIACGSDLLLKRVRSFLVMELPNLLCSEKLLDMMDSKFMIALIKTDRHGVFTDMSLINFIAQWVEKGKADRSQFLPELLRGINLLCFEENLDDILNIPCIQENEKAKECIAQAQEDMISVKNYMPQKEDQYLLSFLGQDVSFASVDTKDSTPLLRMSCLLDVPSREKENLSIGGIPRISAIVYMDDKLFIVMSANGYGECPCYSFDPRRNIWKHLKFLPVNRFGFDLVRLGGEIYAIGGDEVSSDKVSSSSDKVNVYDISKNEWSVGVPTCTHRFNNAYFHAAVVNDKIFILTERKCDITYRTKLEFFRYDPNSELSDAKLPCPTMLITSIGNPSLKLISAGGGVLSILTGANDYLQFNSPQKRLEIRAERYDPVSNEWSPTEFAYDFETSYDRIDVLNGLNYNDEIYLVVRCEHRRQRGSFAMYDNDIISLFRYNENTGNIELVLQDLHLPLTSHAVAMVHVPKLTMARMKMLSDFYYDNSTCDKF